MAQLIKRRSSPFYYARFQVNGRDRWLPTKETDRKKPEKAFKRLHAQAKNEVTIDQQLAILTELSGQCH